MTANGRRIAGISLGCKYQNNFHFLQSLQLHHSELRQTDGDKLKRALLSTCAEIALPRLQSVEKCLTVIGSAVKLATAGDGPVGTFDGVYTGFIRTTSKLDAVMLLSMSRSLLFQ